MDDIQFLSSGSGELELNISSTGMSCAATSLEQFLDTTNSTSLPWLVSVASTILQVVATSVEVVLGLILNIMVVFLVCKYKKLQVLSFAIAIQIAIVDLALILMYGIPNVASNIARGWIFNLDTCVLLGFSTFFFPNIRTFLIFVFSLDRFFSVFTPFIYPKYSNKTVFIMSVLSWLVGLVVSIIVIPQGLDCYIFTEATLSCSFSSRCSSSCQLFLSVYVIFLFLPSIFFPLTFFIVMYIKGRKIRRLEASIHGLTRKMLSNREWHAMKTFFLLFVTVVIVTIIPVILYTTSSLFGAYRDIFVQVGSNLSFLLVVVDPVIIMRNNDVKEILGGILKSCFRHQTPPVVIQNIQLNETNHH